MSPPPRTLTAPLGRSYRFLGAVRDDAEAAHALPVHAHVLGVGLGAANAVAIGHEDANGLSVTVTVTAGKALSKG